MHILVERFEIWDQASKAVQDRLGAVVEFLSEL
jgi:hypothetical protein